MSNYPNRVSSALPMILMVLFLYISAFFLDIAPVSSPTPLFWESLFSTSVIFGNSTLSMILSAIFIILIALSLYIFNNAYTTGNNIMLPFIFVLLVVANPYVIFFSPIHIAALLMMWSIFYSVKYRVNGHKSDSAFTCFFLLGLATFFIPCLVWCFLYFYIINIINSEEKAKFTFNSIIGLILPIVLLSGCYFIFGGENLSLLLKQYGQSMLTIEPKSLNFSIAEICRWIVILSITASSCLFVMRNLGNYKTTKSRAFFRVIWYLLVLVLIFVVFTTSNHSTFGLLLYVPIAIISHEYLSVEPNKKWRNVRNVIFYLVFLSERIIMFLR